jgi:hypothetical protein
VFIVFCIAILLSGTAAAFADNAAISDPLAAHGGRLSCFSIPPPPQSKASCDQLCATKSAACVGLKTNGSMNPGIGCEDTAQPPGSGNYVADCRCCAIAQ